MALGFFTGDGSDDPLDAIRYRKAMALQLLQQDPSDRPYTGIKNFGNSIIGAILLRNALKKDKSTYENSIGSLIGHDALQPVNVTPQMGDGEVPRPPSTYQQPATAFEPGQVSSGLDLDSSKAQMLANLLKGEGPEVGRPQLSQLGLQAIIPKNTEWKQLWDGRWQAFGPQGPIGEPKGERKPLSFGANDTIYPPDSGGGAMVGPQPPLGAPPGNGPGLNNPGNLRPPGATTGFQSFPTPEAGMAAVTHQLSLYGQRGLNTVQKIVSTYAPPTENDTNAYVADVSKQLGVDPSAPLDMADPATLTKLTQAMIRHEQGGAAPSIAPGQIASNAATPPRIPGYGPPITNTDTRHQQIPMTPEQLKQYNAMPGSTINGLGEINRVSTQNVAAPLNEDAAAFAGQTLLATGHLPQGMPRSGAGFTQAVTWAMNHLPKGVNKEVFGNFIRQKMLAMEGDKTAIRAVQQQAGLTAVNEGKVNGAMDILEALLPTAASHGRFVKLNELQQYMARQTNNPAAINFSNALNTVANEYARIVSGAQGIGGSDVAAREAANERILAGYNSGTIKAVMDQMRQEMRNISAAFQPIEIELTGAAHNYSPANADQGGVSVPAPNMPETRPPIYYDSLGNRKP